MLVGAVAVVGIVADRLVARRAADRGTYWTRVLLAAMVPTLALLLVSWLLPDIHTETWQSRWHLMPDLVRPFGENLRALALALPVVIWGLALGGVAVLSRDLADPTPGRWLAGSIGMLPGRWWVLAFPGLALLVLIFFAAQRMPPDDYPAAVVGALVCFLVTLSFIAFSTGSAAAKESTPVRAKRLPPWPEALREHGIAVETLIRYPGSAAPVTGPSDIGALPPVLARRRLPAALLDAVRNHDGNRLIAAPDDWGQIEAIVLIAERLVAAGNMATLVVVPGDAERMKGELVRWLPEANSAIQLGLGTRSDTPAFVWLTDAALLSDRLIPYLSEQPELLGRIGAVAWWDLHQYSGVLAANFWAISHRFRRLLDRRGRPGVRHLAFVRGAPSAETQLTRFRELCLPQGFPPDLQITIDDQSVRSLELHLLCGHLPSSGTRHDLDTALAAARVSVAAGWPTCLSAPAHLDGQQIAAAGRDGAGNAPLSGQLTKDPIHAGARILEVDSATVLSLPSIVAQTGRAGPDQPCLHVGIVPAFGNPYVAHLLRQLAADPQRLHRWSRRMIATVPQPGLIQRHLLLALKELPATTSGLRQAFRWESTAAIDKTLAELAGRHLITRRDVRYLVQEEQIDRLAVEVEYNYGGSPEQARPLTTLGADLVDIFDPSDGPVARIDPERLTIDAYPLRIFMHRGRRYRVGQWSNVRDIIGRGRPMRIDCRREDTPAKTWRVVSPVLHNTRTESGQRDIQIPGRGITRSLLCTSYGEQIYGILEYHQDTDSGRWVERDAVRLPAPVRGPELTTRGMLIELEPSLTEGLASGLFSLAQGLRQVFPVHIGVDSEAVAVLALDNAPIDDRTAQGLVIVDLYPGGIGLVQAIDEEPALIIDLLQRTRAWLAECCSNDAGCDQCLQSPLARSVIPGPIPPRTSRKEAVALLDRILNTQS